jgi:DnaJ domain
MSYHAFSLDPRTVLGLAPGASPEDIQAAYHAKSKKHHPDVGGDEWAFRVVVRAYEVLKVTATTHSSQVWEHRTGRGSAQPQEQRPAWTSSAPFSRTDSSSSAWGIPPETGGDGWAARSGERAGQEPGWASQEAGDFGAQPHELDNVSVEIVWTRHEQKDAGRFSASQEADDPTLSVCMVISWPPHDLVDRAAEFPSSGETLQTLIELFGHLRTGGWVVAARSRIEDGRFVAWLSYPDVLTASDAFLFVRETLQNRGLVPTLQTRDVLIPADHDDAFQETVTAQAS